MVFAQQRYSLYYREVMQRVITIILAIGYLAFVPFCFFGSAIPHTPRAHSDHGIHQTTEHHNATKSSPTASFEFHASMYGDFTGTPLTTSFFLISVLFLLFFIHKDFPLALFTAKDTLTVDKPPKRQAQFLLCRQYVTAWLAQHTLSPTFA